RTTSGLRKSSQVCCTFVSINSSLLLKSLILELQRSAIFRHSPHHVVRCAVGDFCFDFERYSHVRTDQTRQVGNHFVSNASSVTSNSRWIEFDAAVETFWLVSFRRRRR